MKTEKYTPSQIIILIILAALLGLSMFMLWNVSGDQILRFAWPWLVGLVFSASGLLYMARELK